MPAIDNSEQLKELSDYSESLEQELERYKTVSCLSRLIASRRRAMGDWQEGMEELTAALALIVGARREGAEGSTGCS